MNKNNNSSPNILGSIVPVVGLALLTYLGVKWFITGEQGILFAIVPTVLLLFSIFVLFSNIKKSKENPDAQNKKAKKK